jgi:hypothetical protein
MNNLFKNFITKYNNHLFFNGEKSESSKSLNGIGFKISPVFDNNYLPLNHEKMKFGVHYSLKNTLFVSHSIGANVQFASLLQLILSDDKYVIESVRDFIESDNDAMKKNQIILIDPIFNHYQIENHLKSAKFGTFTSLTGLLRLLGVHKIESLIRKWFHQDFSIQDITSSQLLNNEQVDSNDKFWLYNYNTYDQAQQLLNQEDGTHSIPQWIFQMDKFLESELDERVIGNEKVKLVQKLLNKTTFVFTKKQHDYEVSDQESDLRWYDLLKQKYQVNTIEIKNQSEIIDLLLL